MSSFTQSDTNESLPKNRKKVNKKILIAIITILVLAGITMATLFSNAVPLVKLKVAVESIVTNGAVSYIPVGETLKLESGDAICFVGSYPNYAYKGQDCSYDPSSPPLRMEPDHTYTFDRGGKSYDISYTWSDCTVVERQFESDKFTQATGCTIHIDKKKSEQARTASITKNFTVGAGIYIEEGGSMYAKMTNTKDSNRTSISPLLSADPFVGVLQRTSYDVRDNSDPSFRHIWVSKHCKTGKACTTPERYYSDGSGGETINHKLTFATPRGSATFIYSPNDMYEKKTKTVELDHATVVMKVLNLSHSDCGYYCDEDESEKHDTEYGTIYNRVEYSLSYNTTT